MAQNSDAPAPEVIVIDSHEAVRAAVRWWCAHAEPAIAVIGQYGSVREMLDKRRGDVVHGGQVVVLEINSSPAPPALAEQQRCLAAGFAVVVYSHLADHEAALSAMEAGAAAYISKNDPKSELLEAIRVAPNGKYFSGSLIRAAMLKDSRVRRPRLAAREKEILIAWFRTDSKDLVARELRISGSTVRTHLERIRAKYAAVGRAAPTKAALVVRAIQDGIIGIDDL